MIEFLGTSINILTGIAITAVIANHVQLDWWEIGILSFAIQWFLGRSS